MVNFDIVAMIIAGLFLMLLLQVPVGVALALSSIGGLYLITGSLESSTSLLLSSALEITSSPAFLVIPLFILMGGIASQIGIVSQLFDAANKLFGRLPGGLALATTLAAAGFATISGSSISATAAMGRIALPEMVRYGYRMSLIAGCIACSGTFAMMIPPSIVMVFYGIISGQSIGKLLIAGLLPGLLTVVVYAIQIMIRATLDPTLAPRGAAYPWREAVRSGVQASPFFAVLVVLIVGMLSGLWTATEAAAMGVFTVVLLGILRRSFSSLLKLDSAIETVMTTASILLVVMGSLLFGKMLAFTGVTAQLTAFVVAAEPDPLVFFLALMALLIVLGTFLEGMSIIALAVPLILPILPQMGWDPIWFGVIMVKLIEIGGMTPPVGLNLFALQGVAPQVPFSIIIRGCAPFWICELIVLALLYMFPQIVLFLPNLM